MDTRFVFLLPLTHALSALCAGVEILILCLAMVRLTSLSRPFLHTKPREQLEEEYLFPFMGNLN